MKVAMIPQRAGNTKRHFAPITNHVTRGEIADKLLGLMSYRGIRAHTPQVLMDALRTFREHKVDIVDAIVVATARRNGWEAVSFDSDIRKLLK
jgi:predicted nucleic acid-binding protein